MEARYNFSFLSKVPAIELSPSFPTRAYYGERYLFTEHFYISFEVHTKISLNKIYFTQKP
jgi:hypothetical protein